ncbi:glutamate-rich protein 2 isoform 2-T2 [Acanthopagrus schlegelii]
MSRLECLAKPSTGSKKQLTTEVTSTPAEKGKPNDKARKKTVTDAHWSPPARVLPCSVQETEKSGCPRGAVRNTDECSPKESIGVTPRAEEHAQSTAAPEDELKMKDLAEARPPDPAVTGGATHAAPASEPLPTYEENEEQTEEEEDVEEEELQAPVELIIEFLRAVKDGDFQLASKLCQMILIYEPGNPEASEFLPLIQKKLSEDQEAEQSTEEEEDDDDDDDDGDDESGSDEESSQSSSCSSSSCSSSSDEDEEEEKRVNRHKPCPPSQICP